MVSVLSGTSESISTVLTIPVPPHLRQAPWLLKANSSALGACIFSLQIGQMISFSAATFKVGSI